MPIEIRELHIKAEVKNEENKPTEPIDRAAMQEKIIAECVEQVLRILQEKKER